MPTSLSDVFSKRHILRDDGVQVLSRPLISVAALEAGYSLDSPTIDDAVTSTRYPGQMTSEEFTDFCEKNKASFISAEKMAKAVVVIAPTGVITRGSLQQISKKSSNSGLGLNDDEVDTLFDTLDTDNKGAISAEDLMRAMYGEEGALCLAERRKIDADAAAEQKAEADRKVAEQEEREKQKKEEAEVAAQAAAARETEEKEKEKEKKAKEEAATAAAKKTEGEKDKDKAKSKEPEKKKKAKACC